jgi:hypothetical protein
MPYIELDHVQYGRINVPEPGAIVLVALLFMLTPNFNRVRRRRAAVTSDPHATTLKGVQYVGSHQTVGWF